MGESRDATGDRSGDPPVSLGILAGNALESWVEMAIFP